MSNQRTSLNDYAWWLPRVLLLVSFLGLVGLICHRALFDPYGADFRLDPAHARDLDMFVERGFLRVNEHGLIVADRQAFLAYFAEHYKLGQAYQRVQGELGQLTKDRHGRGAGDQLELDREILVKAKILLPEGQGWRLDLQAYCEKVKRTPLGAHFFAAEQHLERFEVVEGKPRPDTWYLRENNRFESRPALPRGRIYDRNGQELAGWADGKRQLNPAPGTRHLVGAKHWGGVEHEADELLNGSQKPGLYGLLGLRGDDRRGDDLQLSIDAGLSAEIYQSFGRDKGGALVMDVQSGEILAAVSLPEPQGKIELSALAKASGKPLTNRVFDELFFTGSTYKIVMASAMLSYPGLEDEAGFRTDPEHRVRDLARYAKVANHDLHVYPQRINLYEAFAVSSNTYFARLGILLGDRMVDHANQWGFNQELSLTANVPGLDWQVSSPRAYQGAVAFKRANNPLIAQYSIGQNLIKSHPLHLATIVQIVANNGLYRQPTLIRARRKGSSCHQSPGSGAFQNYPEVPGRQVITAAHSAVLRKAMEKTADWQSGSAYNGLHIYRKGERFECALRGRQTEGAKRVPIGAKTGTAQDGKRKPHAWFVAYAPADQPRYAVAVLVQNGGLGAVKAGPIAINALRYVQAASYQTQASGPLTQVSSSMGR